MVYMRVRVVFTSEHRAASACSESSWCLSRLLAVSSLDITSPLSRPSLSLSDSASAVTWVLARSVASHRDDSTIYTSTQRRDTGYRGRVQSGHHHPASLSLSDSMSAVTWVIARSAASHIDDSTIYTSTPTRRVLTQVP